MSTAFKIRDLTKHNPTLNSTEIAAAVGCKSGYVRTVWHRAGIFRGPHDASVVYTPPPIYVRVPVAEYEKLLAAAALVQGRERDDRVMARPRRTKAFT
jgi:hypothetical protein